MSKLPWLFHFCETIQVKHLICFTVRQIRRIGPYASAVHAIVNLSVSLSDTHVSVCQNVEWIELVLGLQVYHAVCYLGG